MGEDAEITACFENCLNVRQVKWMRETDTGNHAIDTTLPKYKGTIQETFEQLILLVIRSCDKSDVGKYFLLASCSNREICSNEIYLQVVKGKTFIRNNYYFNINVYYIILTQFVLLQER